MLDLAEDAQLEGMVTTTEEALAWCESNLAALKISVEAFLGEDMAVVQQMAVRDGEQTTHQEIL